MFSFCNKLLLPKNRAPILIDDPIECNFMTELTFSAEKLLHVKRNGPRLSLAKFEVCREQRFFNTYCLLTHRTDRNSFLQPQARKRPRHQQVLFYLICQPVWLRACKLTDQNQQSTPPNQSLFCEVFAFLWHLVHRGSTIISSVELIQLFPRFAFCSSNSTVWNRQFRNRHSRFLPFPNAIIPCEVIIQINDLERNENA